MIEPPQMASAVSRSTYVDRVRAISSILAAKWTTIQNRREEAHGKDIEARDPACSLALHSGARGKLRGTKCRRPGGRLDYVVRRQKPGRVGSGRRIKLAGRGRRYRRRQDGRQGRRLPRQQELVQEFHRTRRVFPQRQCQ